MNYNRHTVIVVTFFKIEGADRHFIFKFSPFHAGWQMGGFTIKEWRRYIADRFDRNKYYKFHIYDPYSNKGKNIRETKPKVKVID